MSSNISLVTYAGQTVTPLDDALVYETAINQSGMIYGGAVTIKNANNLHISSGHGIVCGRKFTIFDSDIQVALSSSGTLLGRLYVQLDLSNVGTPVQLLVETGESLTPVQQDKNVNIQNGVFEFNLATFTVDTSTLSNVVGVAPSAEPSTGAGSIITVTTSEASLAGKMCTITDGTNTLNANFDNNGKAVFYGVQMVGRLLINATDGEYYASGEVAITYFGLYSTSIAFWGATINLTTTTPEFYGQTISITQDGIAVGSTSFDGTGHATYIAPAMGTFVFTVSYGGNDYTATVVVTEQTTYNKSIDIAPAGLDLSAWITAGSVTGHTLNPSSYANFAALEADEAAVRQLMTVHDAVDYLATASAGDSLMEDIINSDVCAKWINISDYAYNTLSANSDIKSVMDTADRYGYGEWVIVDSTTTPPTWGAKGNVPIMTANNAPYGTAFADTEYSSAQVAFAVFNGNTSAGWSSTGSALPHYVGYTSVNPICVKKVSAIIDGLRTKAYQFEASNDGFVTKTVLYTGTNSDQGRSVPIEFDVENDNYFISHRILITESWEGTGNRYSSMISLQFYGRELTEEESSAPTDGREYVQIGSTYYTEDWGEKEFGSGSTMKYIYDHGVELETLTISGTGSKGDNAITLSASGATALASITFTSGVYSTLNGKTGLNASGSPRIVCGSGYAAITDRASLDISSITGANNTGASQTGSGTVDIEELWLE